jgi:hypothetical protein
MPYIQVNDFKAGLDRKRERIAAEAGTLWDLKNGHITRGGDIERNKRFVPVYTLPTGKTFGLAQIKGQLYTFGSQDVAGAMPVGVQYQRLQQDVGTNMVALLDARNNDGKIFAGAEYDDGNVVWFYDGVRITALDTLADANATYISLADYMASKINARTDVFAASFGQTVVLRAVTPGVDFAATATAVNNGVNTDQTVTLSVLQANQVAVAETRGSGTIELLTGSFMSGVNTVSQVLIGGVNVLPAAVDFLTSVDVTANRVATAINAGGLTTYVATANLGIVTLTAPAGLGALANGVTIATVVAGDVTTLNANVSGGISAVTAAAKVVQIAFGGTFEPLDLFTVTINLTPYRATGRASGQLSNAFVYKKRLYAVANSLLRYCAISAPTDWTTVTPASGASFINMNSDSEGSERLSAIEQYQTYVGIWSRRLIRLYALNTDATLNTFIQTLQNTGTIAPKSVVAYGNTDVFYLDQTGIRSIKARDASNAAFVSDVGTNIDKFIRDYITTLSSGIVQKAVGLVDPVDGRFWLAIGARIFVLSYYPSAKVQAWSYYDMTSNVDGMVAAFNQIFVRRGDVISLYGGFSGEEYPLAGEQPCTVRTPFLNAQDPASDKMVKAFDIACVNEWLVTLLPDPGNEAKYITIGRPTGISYTADGTIKVDSRADVVALDFVCSAAGRAVLSSFSVHFDKS